MKTFIHISCLIVVAIAMTSAFAGDAPMPIEPENVALGRPVEFERDVRPILEANCTACHSRSSEESDLSLESVESMLKGGGRGPAIVAGKADESLLLAVAAHRREPVMPPPDNDVKARQLTPHELGILRQWILEGAARGETTAAMIRWRPLPTGYKAIHAVDLSPTNRFVAAARGSQVEIYDLTTGGPPIRLVDPALAALQYDGKPTYADGAADRDIIQSVAFSPDDAILATGGYRAIRLWHRNVFSEAMPRFDVAGVQSMAFSADGSLVAVSLGSELRLLSQDGTVVAKWAVPANTTAIAVSSDGGRVAALCADHSIHAWSREGQESLVRQSAAPATAIAFVGEKIVTSREEGIIDVWSSASEQAERELKGQVGRVVALLDLPDHPYGLVSAGEDGTIRVWDVTNVSPIRTISHGSGLSAIAVARDGQRLASCGADGAVRIWNTSDGAKVGEHVGLVSRRQNEQRSAEQLEWRKQLAAVEDARIKEAEAAVKDREEIHKKSIEAKTAAETALAEADKAASEKATAAKAAADALAAAPNDENLKKQADDSKKAADEATAKATAAKSALESAERARALAEAALKTQQERLAARQQTKSAADEAVKSAEAEWNSKKEAAAQSVPAKAIAFTADGSRVVVAYAGGVLQSLSATGQPLDELTIGDSEINRLGSTAGVCTALCADGSVRRFDPLGHWELAATLGPPAEASLDVAKSEIVDRVLALAFSPDGTMLASGGGEPSRAGELLLWNVAERKLARRIEDPHSDTVQAVAFSRDGQIIATAGADKFVKTFEATSGELRHAFEGHSDQVLGVSIKADGTLIASASADLGVKIWDRESGEQRRTITGHGKQVTAVHFMGLTEDVVTAAGDKTVRFERTSNGQQFRTFSGPTDYVFTVAANDDASLVVAAGEDGVLYIWDGKNGSLKQRIEPLQVSSTVSAAK